MKAWWQLWEKCFTPDECVKLIEYAKTLPPVEGGIGHGGQFHQNKQVRSSIIRWIPRYPRGDAFMLDFFARISARAEWSNNQAFGFDLRHYTEVQFTEYDSEYDGHYDEHEDNTWVTKEFMPEERKMSMVIQLSDPKDYEGGRLMLKNDPLPDDRFRGQGDMIFFPSFNRHSVTPVTSGKRYSLVTWFKGPPFR